MTFMVESSKTQLDIKVLTLKSRKLEIGSTEIYQETVLDQCICSLVCSLTKIDGLLDRELISHFDLKRMAK